MNISFAVRSPFRIVNVRAWDCLFSDRSSEAGTTGEWHVDQFVNGSLKLMIYLEPVNNINAGTTEFENYGALCSEFEGCVVLFDNNKLLHRAIRPGSNIKRPIIELTLQRLLTHPLFIYPLAGSSNDKHLNNPITAYIWPSLL